MSSSTLASTPATRHDGAVRFLRKYGAPCRGSQSRSPLRPSSPHALHLRIAESDFVSRARQRLHTALLPATSGSSFPRVTPTHSRNEFGRASVLNLSISLQIIISPPILATSAATATAAASAPLALASLPRLRHSRPSPQQADASSSTVSKARSRCHDGESAGRRIRPWQRRAVRRGTRPIHPWTTYSVTYPGRGGGNEGLASSARCGPSSRRSSRTSRCSRCRTPWKCC
jgi:hypothetical protein